MAVADATEAARLQTRQEYAADVEDASRRLAQGDLARVAAVLTKYDRPAGEFPGQDDPRGFEWRYLQRVSQSPSELVFPAENTEWNLLVFTADRRLAAVERNGQVVAWDLESGREAYRLPGPAKAVGFDRDGHYCVTLSTNSESEVRVHQAADGKHLQSFPVGLLATCMSVHRRRLHDPLLASLRHPFARPQPRRNARGGRV